MEMMVGGFVPTNLIVFTYKVNKKLWINYLI
jgi:hypothetical protein